MGEWHRKFIRWQTCRSAKVIAGLEFESAIEVGAKEGVLADDVARLTGRHVTATDYKPRGLCWPERVDAHFMPFSDDSYDLVLCSNTLEHLHTPRKALREFARVGKSLWLSWTPFWSPFGGHDFSPWHYVGMRRGWHPKTGYVMGETLFVTTVAGVLGDLRDVGFDVQWIRPRYWPKLTWLASSGLTREWATWNVELYARKAGE